MGADDRPGKTAPLADATAQIAQARSAPRRLALLLYHRSGAVVVPLRNGAPLVVGRDASSDVVVEDDSLSRRHARFTLTGGGVLVEDLGSTNGLRAGSARVERVVLSPGEEVYLGTVAAGVHASSAAAMAGTDSHDTLRATLDLDIARARYFRRSVALLTVRADKGEGASVSRFCHRLQALLRPIDRVAIYSPDTVDVLVPEVSLEEASVLARRIVELPGPPQLLCGAAVFPASGTSTDALLQAAHTAAARASLREPFCPAGDVGARTLAAGTPGQGRDGAREGTGGPIAGSAAMRALFKSVERLASTRVPVLIIGETGTGKEVLAKAIHDAGPRHKKPMICVNCGAIPRELVESALFGTVRGAFTGSVDKEGVFESANGSTLLLDEVGELPLAAQVALLRVLETKRVKRVGSNQEIEVDARVIAATHRDLTAMCEAGTFREDLLYRLNVFPLQIPPLRERREDIGPLAAHFLERANLDEGRFVAGFEPEALSLLQVYRWPGNARELRNAVQHALVLATGERIQADDLPERIRAAPGASGPAAGPEPVSQGGEPSAAGGAGTVDDYAARMARLEAEMLSGALHQAGWHPAKAAEALKMPLRTLQHKIKVLGLNNPRGKKAP